LVCWLSSRSYPGQPKASQSAPQPRPRPALVSDRPSLPKIPGLRAHPDNLSFETVSPHALILFQFFENYNGTLLAIIIEHKYGYEGWATNLTDEQTRSITFNLPLRGGAAGRAAFINAPREYGVTLRTKF